VIRAAVALAVALVVGCGAAGGATPPSLRGSVPSSLVAGQPWLVRVSGGPVTAVRARSAGRVVTAPARRLGRSYVARITLPAAGSWRVFARTGSSERPLARVHALASYPLALPAQALADGGSLLVVERLGRDRVLRVDIATGRVTVATKSIPAPWGLARAADGVLVSGLSGIYALDGRRVADVRASPIAPGRSGELFYANEAEVGRVDAGHASVLTTDVDVPHGLFVAADGGLLVSDSGRNRLIRVDPATGAVRVLATGLEQGLGAIDDGDDGALVVEFGPGRLTQSGRTGRSPS
jgi:hypothetical protein